MTGEEWDTRWWVTYNDAVRVGYAEAVAAELANRETAEQFGPHPEDVAS